MLPKHIAKLVEDCATLPTFTADDAKYARARYRQIAQRRRLGEHEQEFLALVEATLDGAGELRLAVLLQRTTDALKRFVLGPRRRRRNDCTY